MKTVVFSSRERMLETESEGERWDVEMSEVLLLVPCAHCPHIDIPEF